MLSIPESGVERHRFFSACPSGAGIRTGRVSVTICAYLIQQTGPAMRYLNYLLWPLKFVLFVVLFAFAMQNAEAVALHFFLGYEWRAPLALILLIFFVLGALFGLLACTARMASLRRELVALRRELRNRNNPVATRPAMTDIPHDAL